jgi:uncharacterized protein YqeY
MRASGPDGQPGGGEPGPDIRSRLRLALTEALKARDKDAASALRSALSAIGNAEAVDAGEAGSGRPAASGSVHFSGAVAGLGAAEAERRHLTEADVAAIVRAEAAERGAAASQYERTGHAGQAAGIRRGTRALMAALDGPGGGEEPG